MKDFEERLKGGNQLEPLLFAEGKIGKFINKRACGFCGSHLIAYFADERKYTANCPEHGPMLEHTHISQHAAEVAEQTRIEGRREFRTPRQARSEQEILKELGF